MAMSGLTSTAVFQDAPVLRNTSIYRAIANRSHTDLLRALGSRTDPRSGGVKSSPSSYVSFKIAEDDVTLCEADTRFSYMHIVAIVTVPDTEQRMLPMVYLLSNSGVDVNAVDRKYIYAK